MGQLTLEQVREIIKDVYDQGINEYNRVTNDAISEVRKQTRVSRCLIESTFGRAMLTVGLKNVLAGTGLLDGLTPEQCCYLDQKILGFTLDEAERLKNVQTHVPGNFYSTFSKN